MAKRRSTARRSTTAGNASATAPLLYRYRSLANWKFVMDIFLNNRLFAASFKDMNDPMEGRYFYHDDHVAKEFRRAIRRQKDEWKICSLSRTEKNTLMWSYYADGHKGIAIGVKLRNAGRYGYKTQDVIYDSELYLDPSKVAAGPESAALHILSQKQYAWQHEQEVRVFARDQFVEIHVEQVCFGCLVDPSDRELIVSLAQKTNPKVTFVEINRSQLDKPIRDFAA